MGFLGTALEWVVPFSWCLKGEKENMLKKLIKYTDYDGRERSENFYFYLSKAELVEMEMRSKNKKNKGEYSRNLTLP